MLQVSIIILTYNSDKYIKELLEGILKEYKKEIEESNYEVIVVDNASSDTTTRLVASFEKDGVFLIKNPENVGFAKGENVGSKKAKGKYLLFMNPDTQLYSGRISDLVLSFEKLDNVGVVGGKLLNFSGKPELSAGKFYNLLNTFFLALGVEEILGTRFSPKKMQKVDFVSGGFMMVERDKFLDNGGFDENIFMYVEDMELCFRMKKKGYNTYFSSAMSIKHVGQGSSNKAFAIVNIYKGLLYFHKKHSGYFSYILVKWLFVVKASILVMLGKVSNNKYLIDTYEKALAVCR